LPNVGPYIYTTLAFLALLGAPYIYDISSLRVNTVAYESASYRYDSQRRQNLLSIAWTDGGHDSPWSQVFERCEMIHIQGVPGGMDKTSGECSLC